MIPGQNNKGGGGEQIITLLYVIAIILGVVFVGWIIWAYLLRKKNQFGGKEWPLKRNILLIIISHYTILFFITFFAWRPNMSHYPAYNYILTTQAADISKFIVMVAGTLPVLGPWYMNTAAYLIITIIIILSISHIVKPKTYQTRTISPRRVAHYMEKGNLIIPTRYQEIKEKGEKHGLVVPMATCGRSTYLVGAPGTGKTQQALTIYDYITKFYPESDNVHVIFDVKRDWINEFYNKEKDNSYHKEKDIILGYSGSTHQWNIFKEAAGNEENMKTLITEMLPYHPGADTHWIDTARDIATADAVALMRHAAKENLEINNSDFLNALRMQLEDMASFLQKYNTGTDFNTAGTDFNTALGHITGKAASMTSSIISSMRTDIEKSFIGDFNGKNTKLPNISIKDYIENPKGRKLFIKYDEMHGLQMKPIFRLLYGLALMYSFNEDMEVKQRNKIFVNDEFSLTPNLERYQRALNVGRDYHIFLITCLQSIGQIYSIYGHDEAHAIIGGHQLKIFFRTGDPADRECAKNHIGNIQEVVEDETRILGKKSTTYRPWNDSIYDTLQEGMAIVQSPYGYNRVGFHLYNRNKELFIKARKIYYLNKIKKVTKERLDKFGPFGSAIGALIGGVSFFIYPASPFGLISVIFAYVLCTCTHRKYLIYSSGALGGAIGAFLGVCVTYFLGFFLSWIAFGYRYDYHPLLTEEGKMFLAFVILMPIPILTFLFSRYMCGRAQRKQKIGEDVGGTKNG